MESWKDAKSTEGRKQQQVSFRDHHLGDLLYDYYHTLSKGIKYFISNIYCLTPTVMTNKLTIIDLSSIT